MNKDALKASIVNRGLTVEDFISQLSDQITGFTRDMYYSRVSGRTEFKRSEIAACKEVLGLTDEETVNIFIK